MPKPFLVTLATGALLVGGCADATRSLNALTDDGAYVIPNETEIALRTGAITTQSGRPAQSVRRRIAVVIGNSNYSSVSVLDNPRRDANAMADLLQQQGFQVIRGFDLSKQAFERLLRDTVVHAGPDADILAFYAGHGFQVGERSFLVPVDAQLRTENDLPFQTVRLSSLVKVIDDGARRHVSFLDSCRNNPFAGQAVKPGISPESAMTEQGFGVPAVPDGGLIAYSTSPGALAFDGEGQPNSPYTAALLSRVRERPDAPIGSTLSRVTRDVRRATQGEQVPVHTSRLSGTFAFAEPEATFAALDRPDVSGTGDTAQTRPAPTVTPQRITLDLPFERVTALGQRLADALALAGDTKLAFDTPQEGTLAALSSSGAFQSVSQISAEDLSSAMYFPSVAERPAPARIEQAATSDTLVATITNEDGSEQKVSLFLRLRPGACDFHAGDWLDPQGIGLYRSDDAVDPPRAVAACLAQVRDDPQNGRLHFLLGKAHQLNGDPNAALSAFQKADGLGHLRASLALARIALAEGTQASALARFERVAAAGDPLAALDLAKLQLFQATTAAEREAAYERLGVAMDLGLPDAMRALSDHFDIATSVDHDPDRAAVFDREAEVRETAQKTVSPSGGFGAPDIDRGGGDSGGDDGGKR